MVHEKVALSGKNNTNPSIARTSDTQRRNLHGKPRFLQPIVNTNNNFSFIILTSYYFWSVASSLHHPSRLTLRLGPDS